MNRPIGLAILVLSGVALQAQPAAHGIGGSQAIPYRGSLSDAWAASQAGKTIPLATFSFTATKDNGSHTDTIIGRSPFSRGKTTTTINVLLIPVIVEIGSTTFDPTAVDGCIAGASTSPLAAVQNSPLFQDVVFDGGSQAGHAAEMNGVNMGTTIYHDAFRRAEFWNLVEGTPYRTQFNVTTLSPWTISSSTVQSLGGGNVLSTGCAPLGVLNSNNFDNYITGTVIPGIPAITPTTFALFLVKDVVTTTSSALNCLSFCTIGYHSAAGSPPQVYAVASYDTTANFWYQSGIKDISIITHEIGESMDDPLVSNITPAWGNIGQFLDAGCSDIWEVGDPLTGTDFPAILMPNGVTYHPQELTFWSWFYNSQSTPSIGAGGKFSANGSFSGPAKACPPGGTY